MKKILLALFVLIITTGSAFAAEFTDNELDVKRAINSIKEIRYNVEAGVNIRNYGDVVSKAGIEYRKYVDKYPEISQDVYPKSFLNMMLDPYVDAGKVWHNAVYTRNKDLDDNDMSILFSKYPILKTKLTPTYLEDARGRAILSTKGYWYENVMRGLWSIASEQEKILDIK